MISKRLAIQAIFMGAMAKMANAAEPPKVTNAPLGVALPFPTGPVGWSVNLDQMTFLTVYFKDQKVTISAEEVFAALKP